MPGAYFKIQIFQYPYIRWSFTVLIQGNWNQYYALQHFQSWIIFVVSLASVVVLKKKTLLGKGHICNIICVDQLIYPNWIINLIGLWSKKNSLLRGIRPLNMYILYIVNFNTTSEPCLTFYTPKHSDIYWQLSKEIITRRTKNI